MEVDRFDGPFENACDGVDTPTLAEPAPESPMHGPHPVMPPPAPTKDGKKGSVRTPKTKKDD